MIAAALLLMMSDPTIAACRLFAGEAGARRIVKACIQVSPATHPPCHPDNSCDIMLREIRRSCALFDAGGKPQQCADYVTPTPPASPIRK